MKICIRTSHECYRNDIGDIVRLFYGEYALVPEGGDALLIHKQANGKDSFTERVRLIYGTRTEEETLTDATTLNTLEEKRREKRAIKQACYAIFKRVSGRKPAWGSLTGIRPTRLFYRALEEGRSFSGAEEYLIETYDLSRDKAQLLTEIVRMQQPYYKRHSDAFDLYVGIPFCTSRCSYCSFSSGVIGDGKLVEPYLESLQKEIEACSRMAGEAGPHLAVGYMGGGTPSSLSTGQLDRLLTCVEHHFPDLEEWTIEAGRPDTLDDEKLRMLRSHPVTRISINPQTMNDVTLQRIGRLHTVQDTVRVFESARRHGFDNINMDVIAALPGETEEMFSHTLNEIRQMGPESLTVHTLAIKRSSKLHEQGYSQTTGRIVENMVDAGRQCAHDMGMQAYYLYRQKYMADNLENVGYCLPDKVCRYNIDNMEEIRSVLALGAGSISKGLLQVDERILRVPNLSNIRQYIERIDEMIERKRQMFDALTKESKGDIKRDHIG